ncbi:MAG: DDE-type integrase/transposase/recombinase [Nocardioides sp.]
MTLELNQNPRHIAHIDAPRVGTSSCSSPKVYCCVVLDAYSRKVVGWSIGASPTAGLVTNALGMAIDTRLGHAPRQGRSFTPTMVFKAVLGLHQTSEGVRPTGIDGQHRGLLRQLHDGEFLVADAG